MDKPNAATLRIPAGLSAAELAQASMDLTTDWIYAGVADGQIDKTQADLLAGNVSVDEFETTLANQHVETYAAALYGDDWKNNPEALEAAKNAVGQNITTLKTALAQAAQGFPVVASTNKVSEVTETKLADGERQIAFTLTEMQQNIDDPATTISKWTQTFKEVNGEEILVSSSAEKVS